MGMQRLCFCLEGTVEGDIYPKTIVEAKEKAEKLYPVKVTAFYADTETLKISRSATVSVNGDRPGAVDKAIEKLQRV